MDIVNEEISEFLLFLEDEATELWVIPTHLERMDANLSVNDIKILTKQVVRELITKYKVKGFDQFKLESYDISVDEAMKKIDDIFDEYPGNLPDIGCGFWMSL